MSQDPKTNSEIQRFEAQYRENPDSLVFARLADAYRKAGHPARALEVLESGIGRHGNYPSAHIVRAKTCVDLGDTGPAEEAFLRVVRIGGQHAPAVLKNVTVTEPQRAAATPQYAHPRLILQPDVDGAVEGRIRRLDGDLLDEIRPASAMT